MNETLKTNWPGVRETRDGKFCFSINVGNRTYVEGEYFDAEAAALALDVTKFAFVQTGHLQRANTYNFPAEVSQWQNGAKNTPQPCSALLAFMKQNSPRYLPAAERQVEEAQKQVKKEKRALTAALPSPPKLFAAHQTVSKLLAASPSHLNAEQCEACKTVLELLNTLWSTH